VGPSTLRSPQPSRGGDQPPDLLGGGLFLGAGYQLGLGRLGLAATLSYEGALVAFGEAHTRMRLHEGSGWLAAVACPGALRLALGPTWGVMAAHGTWAPAPDDSGRAVAYSG